MHAGLQVYFGFLLSRYRCAWGLLAHSSDHACLPDLLHCRPPRTACSACFFWAWAQRDAQLQGRACAHLTVERAQVWHSHPGAAGRPGQAVVHRHWRAGSCLPAARLCGRQQAARCCCSVVGLCKLSQPHRRMGGTLPSPCLPRQGRCQPCTPCRARTTVRGGCAANPGRVQASRCPCCSSPSSCSSWRSRASS